MDNSIVSQSIGFRLWAPGCLSEHTSRQPLTKDSDVHLEHLVCLQQTQPDSEFFDLGDEWGVKVWDVEPRCQIAAIAEGESVVPDGAYDASIQWDGCES